MLRAGGVLNVLSMNPVSAAFATTANATAAMRVWKVHGDALRKWGGVEQTIRTDDDSPRFIRGSGPANRLRFSLMNDEPPPGPTAEAPTLATAARWVVILLGSYFLLRELGPILKPLFLAVLLGYVILPIHLMVKKWVPGRLSLIASAILSLILILLLTVGIQATIRTLAGKAPGLNAKALEMKAEFLNYADGHFPRTSDAVNQIAFPEGDSAVRDWTSWLVNVTASTLTTAAVVALYLMFLLLESGRFPDRVHRAFTEKRAERIMHTVAGINRGIAHYSDRESEGQLHSGRPNLHSVVRLPNAVRPGLGHARVLLQFRPYLGSVQSAIRSQLCSS